MFLDLLKAVALGAVEGLTEFLPVSSTGHLLLANHVLGFSDDGFGKAFVVLIQLGAVLAILSAYSVKLWNVAMALPRDVNAQRFVLGVLLAFLPAAFIGVLAHSFIKGALFNVWVVCTTLIIGGFVLLWIDRLKLPEREKDAMRFPLPMYLGIGVAQCVAMIPGVSRSGATIVAAMLFGADKRAAAEFSFFLAIPTMAGAFAYDLYKNWAQMDANNTLLVAAGFVSSFIAAFFVVKTFLDYVSRHGFSLFAYWRIGLGSLGLIALFLIG